MTNALFGRGLVGSHVPKAYYDVQFNSENFKDAKGQTFKTVFVAGVSGTKYKANEDPIGDMERIQDLWHVLKTIKCERIIHFSTVDVFGQSWGHSEYDSPRPNTAYGRNRLDLEQFMRHHFQNDELTIVRLPGLFGHGMKKNAIYDLLEGHRLEHLNPMGIYQWYDLSRLDIDLANFINSDRSVIHVSPHPVSIGQIVNDVFPEHEGKIGSEAVAGPTYGMQTLWSLNSFPITVADTITDLKRFKLEWQNSLP